jgi:hypothetical protein
VKPKTKVSATARAHHGESCSMDSLDDVLDGVFVMMPRPDCMTRVQE